MKILIASLFFPRFSATHAGGRFVAELIRELSKNHEVHLAARIEETERESIGEMKPYCRMSLFPYRETRQRGLLTLLQLGFSYLHFGLQLNGLIRTDRFDLIQAEWVETGILMKKSDTPMVLDAHDVITKPVERSMRRKQGIRRIFGYILFRIVRTLEIRTMKKFDCILTRAEYDKQYLVSLSKDLPVTVVPHPAGLDITEKRYVPQKHTILFLASFKHRPTNVEAAMYFYREIFPRVRERIPDAMFIVAGYGPPEQLIDIGRKDPSVLITGFVENIDECYKKAAVFVAPILVGGGIIVKILDAMAAGVPVVTTQYGNEGIGAESGRHLIIADSPEAFAAGVIKLLENGEYADHLGENGQNYIRKNFSKKSVFSKLEKLYMRLEN